MINEKRETRFPWGVKPAFLRTLNGSAKEVALKAQPEAAPFQNAQPKLVFSSPQSRAFSRLT
jgi:hypothetical protein